MRKSSVSSKTIKIQPRQKKIANYNLVVSAIKQKMQEIKHISATQEVVVQNPSLFRA